MDDDAHAFNGLRPRLQKIAYRMLGSVAEAEDIVQDVWLRWHAAARENIDNAEAWLVAVTTRMSIDRLRAAKTQREHYTGIWLPEPEMTSSPATPEEVTERADDVSVAFLALLERLYAGYQQGIPRGAPDINAARATMLGPTGLQGALDAVAAGPFLVVFDPIAEPRFAAIQPP